MEMSSWFYEFTVVTNNTETALAWVIMAGSILSMAWMIMPRIVQAANLRLYEFVFALSVVGVILTLVAITLGVTW